MGIGYFELTGEYYHAPEHRIWPATLKGACIFLLLATHCIGSWQLITGILKRPTPLVIQAVPMGISFSKAPSYHAPAHRN